MSAEPDCRFLQVCLLFRFLSVTHEQAPTGGILKTELSAWPGRSADLGSSGLDQNFISIFHSSREHFNNFKTDTSGVTKHEQVHFFHDDKTLQLFW